MMSLTTPTTVDGERVGRRACDAKTRHFHTGEPAALNNNDYNNKISIIITSICMAGMVQEIFEDYRQKIVTETIGKGSVKLETNFTKIKIKNIEVQ